MAAGVTFATAPLIKAIGVGPLFSICAGITAVLMVILVIDQFIYSWTADKKETFSLPPEVDEHFINQWSSNGLKEVTIKSYASYIRGISLDKFALPQSLKKKMNLPENTKLLCSIKGKPCTVGVPKQRKISTVFQAYYPLLICSNESMDALKEKSLDSSYDRSGFKRK